MLTCLLMLISGPLYSPYNKQTPVSDYAETLARATKDKVPIVVFVGCEKRQIVGTLDCQIGKLEGCAPQCIIIGRPNAINGMEWVAELPATATNDDIGRILYLRRSAPLIPPMMPQPQRSSVSC